MSYLGNRGATPARRSARLSQAGSVTGQSAITTTTTGGTKRTKKGPLTKVKNRKSNAYGASGRVGAAEELAISATGFAQAFQHQRGDAVDEGAEEDDVDELGAELPLMSGALNGHIPYRSPSPEVRAPQETPGDGLEDYEDPMPSEFGFTPSIGNTSKSFGLGHEAGMLHEPQVPSSRHSPAEDRYERPTWLNRRWPRNQTQPNIYGEKAVDQVYPVEQTPSLVSTAKEIIVEESVDELVEEEQARLQRDGPPKPRDTPRGLAPAQRRDNPQSFGDWVRNAEFGYKDETEWNWKKIAMWVFWGFLGIFVLLQALHFVMSDEFPETNRKPGLINAVNTRVANAYYDLADWVMPAPRDHEKAAIIDWLHGDGTNDDHYIWSRMRKIYTEFDGRIGSMNETITDLNAHLPEYMVVRRFPDGRREVTDEFWKALVSKAKSSSDSVEWIDFLKSNGDKLRDYFGVPVPVDTSDARPEAVSRHEFLELVQRHYNTLSKQIDQQIKDAFQSQAPKIMAMAQAEVRKAMVDSIRLESLAQGNLIANYEHNMRKANFFSPGLGAVVEPRLTSSTFLDIPHPFARIGRRLGMIRLRHPPKYALTKWEEPGDCWCAAPGPSRKGRAQLTVSLALPVFPEQVTIEHLPKPLMFGKNISNAPRTVELWVETDQPARFQYAHRQGVCLEGPPGWVCLGSFSYDIHASNYRQTFDLDAESPVPVSKAMVRVTSNWGADHTCLYRVRLHGRDAVEDHAYNVGLSDPAE